jgi:hypothetical protein
MTSIIKVDNLQNQCGANIINENAGTITIGASGDTVTLAAGASQSGFGRSGSVNWDTTPKTTGFTAVSGNGYFCDTTSAAFTVTLPATPSAGDIVAIADYDGTAITNNITVGRNSSDINGSATDLTINANYSAVTLVYVDATAGWRSVDSSNPNDIVTPPAYVAATGGTVTCCGDYKIHTFTGPGTFTVSCAGNPGGSNSVEYLVVAGGGGGGAEASTGGGGGGGGAGGLRYVFPQPATAGLPVTATGYPITVGGGGPAGNAAGGAQGGDGSNSVFSTITSTAGGGGGGAGSPIPATNRSGRPGGSGGGAGDSFPGINNGSGAGNTPPVSPSQGFPGGGYPGTGPGIQAEGGGGHAQAGSPLGGADQGIAPCASSEYGAGGNGSPFPTALAVGCAGTPGPAPGRYFAGGGGGAWDSVSGRGGYGGGATASSSANPGPGGSGVTNTGGGGGGSGQCSPNNSPGGSGGSGIVIIRYKYQ